MFFFRYSYFLKHWFVYVKWLVVQNRITAFWFRDKELAMAFGFTIAFSRLGSVLNFLVTAHIDELFGLQWTLWVGEYHVCFFELHNDVLVALQQQYPKVRLWGYMWCTA